MFQVFIDGNDDSLRLEDPEGRNGGWCNRIIEQC